MELANFTPRIYQQNILKTCLDKNTLVVLPTGIGKTAIAMLLASERMKKFPESKILITAPTKPLCNQHVHTFKQHTTNIEIALFTGSLVPSKRHDLFDQSKIIIATPQTIESDLQNNRISLENFSLICLDEAHRSRANYANTFIVKKYLEQSKFPRILALTASPGSSKERIEEICNNLAIEAVEIRTEHDEDVSPYIQKKDISWISIELTQEITQLASIIRKVYEQNLEKLQNLGFSKPVKYINKKDLLMLQKRFQSEITSGSKIAFYGISLVAQIIKVEHALALIETQTISALENYWKKLEVETTKAAKTILANPDIKRALQLTQKLIENKVKHPKIIKLIEIIKKDISENKEAKIIVFATYRDTVAEIARELNLAGIKAKRFVGQADRQDKGQNQVEQQSIIDAFKNHEFNILVASSVGEEGLDLPEVAAVVFYEPIPSELRKIQRQGRTARTKPGKVIFLMAKKTRDEAYYWSSLRKEKLMKNILLNIKTKKEKQAKLQ
ncbi:MAG TPA: DEAD/DEAH box helicase [Candidatus Nanoarchaeia archaeon]|nr:DEAD/DEAH box helicase [Candidatus Nanoarchaeia archaeon]